MSNYFYDIYVTDIDIFLYKWFEYNYLSFLIQELIVNSQVKKKKAVNFT